MDANPFATALDTAAAARPRHPYLVPMDGPAISFADFADQCRAWAASLQGLGCGSGQRVALLMDNRPEYVLAWYASQLTGATVVSLNPMLPEDSQRHLLRLTSPRVCLVGLGAPADAAARALAAEGVPVIDVSGWRADPAGPGRDVTPVALEPGHPSQVIFTSGTTGRPKGAVQSAGQLTGLLAVAQRVGLTPGDRLLCTAPLYHGLAQSWFQYGLAVGAAVVLAPRFSASRFWDDCRTYDVTASQHVGAVLSFLLRRPPDARDRDHRVRLTFGVGAPMRLWEEFRRRFGVEVVEFYGMTEVGLMAFNDRPARPGSVGRPAGVNEVRLVGDDDKDVAPGEVGEAWTRPCGPGGKRPEYFGDPQATRAAQQDGWFRTGDLLYADADGYLYFVGRKKESLRRRGENIVPDDIERSVTSLPTVEECAAVGVPSPYGDDDIMLCLVLAAGPGEAPGQLGEAQMAALATEIRAALPSAMRPAYLTVHASLPYTATSKLRRTELRSCPLPRWDVEAAAWLPPTGPKEAQ
jgi:carnitine-CoA ligase